MKHEDDEDLLFKLFILLNAWANVFNRSVAIAISEHHGV
jgi:hypothetical protein